MSCILNEFLGFHVCIDIRHETVFSDPNRVCFLDAIVITGLVKELETLAFFKQKYTQFKSEKRSFISNVLYTLFA